MRPSSPVPGATPRAPAQRAASTAQREVVLTGDRPTGPLHLGHFAGSLRTRLALQYEHDHTILIADLQALTDNAGRPVDARRQVVELALDYLAVGIDPTRAVARYGTAWLRGEFTDGEILATLDPRLRKRHP